MRSSARPLYLAFATSTLLFAASAVADEPKEPLPSVPVAPPGVLPQAAPVTPDRIAEALAPQPGGLTPNEVGRLALRAKPNLRVKEAELREAAAKADQALLAFIPKLSGTASYTRLSPVKNSLGTQTVFGTANGSTFTPGIPTGGLVSSACPQVPLPNTDCVRVIDQTGQQSDMLAVTQVPFNFPVLLNSYSFTAQLAVPVSDYVLRLSHAYAAATHGETAKKYDLQAAELQTVTEAKVAFYNWVLAKGKSVVVSESVAQASAHLDDVTRTFAAGLASKADVLRLEAQKAAAEQAAADASTMANLAELSLRISLGLPEDKPLVIGVDVLHDTSAPMTQTLEVLQKEALEKRLEVRQITEAARATSALVSVARAQYAPRIDAFANATYANPNQRFFPQRGEFHLTWEAGVRMSWTVNDTLAAPAAVAEAQARAAQTAALKEQILQGLKLEVAQAYGDLKRAEATIEAADRGLVAAEESLRVQTELFRAGRSTSSAIVDAETAVVQARLQRISARVGVLIAKTKLEHASGRDVPSSS